MRALIVQGVRIDVDRVVADLRAIDHSTAWERTMRVGKIVFEGIFVSDAVEWRAKRSNKLRSLRKLVHHPQCPFKKSALSSAVNVYLFLQDHPAIGQLPNLTPTHVSSACSLPVPAALELLAAASAGGWTIRELAERVHQLRRESGERRGRPRAVANQRAEAMARRCLRSLEGLQRLLADGTELDGIARARLLELLESVGTACACVQNVTQLDQVEVRGLARFVPHSRAAGLA